MNTAVVPTDPHSEPSQRVWLPHLGAAVLALVTLVWLSLHHAPAIMSPDANGYVVQARLMATQGRTSLVTASPAQYVGTHWLETGDGVFHSRYPAGLPLLYAAAWKVGGLRAALAVNPLLAAATVLLTFLLARRLADGWSALLAAAVVATNASFQQHALDADAHIAAAFFLTAGVLALLEWQRRIAVGGDEPQRKAAATMALGALAGVLLGLVPTVRYPEALAGVAIGAWLLWQIRPVWRAWPAVLGATLPIGALFIHNAAAYGAFWRTGYALTNEQTGFGWSYFTAHWLAYLNSLGGSGLGIFFAFGAAGLAALAAEKRHRAVGALLAGIVVPLVLLYMAYYFGGGGDGNLRFLIPIFPLLAVAGAWLLARLATALGSAGRAVWIVVAVLQLLPAAVVSTRAAVQAHASLVAADRARVTLERAAPAGAVVIVDHQFGESLDAVGQWRLVEENLVSLGGARMGAMARGGQRPGLGAGFAGGPPAGAVADQPSPQQANKNRAQRARYDGVTPAVRRARVWADIRAWAGDRPVFWFARSLDLVDNALPDDADYESVAEIEAPAMMGPGGGGRGGPGGPGMGGPMGGRGFMPGAGAMGPPMMGGPGGGPGMGFMPGAGMGGPPMGGPGLAPGPAQNQKLRLVKITFVKAK